MAFFDTHALWRVQFPFAKTLVRIVKKLQVVPRAQAPFPKGISDHIARDIGLSAYDLELLRHEMPSQKPGRHSI